MITKRLGFLGAGLACLLLSDGFTQLPVGGDRAERAPDSAPASRVDATGLGAGTGLGVFAQQTDQNSGPPTVLAPADGQSLPPGLQQPGGRSGGRGGRGRGGGGGRGNRAGGGGGRRGGPDLQQPFEIDPFGPVFPQGRGGGRGRRGGGWNSSAEVLPPRDVFPGNYFTFARVRYGYGNRDGGSWKTDYPDSDLNFSQRLEEFTTIPVAKKDDGSVEHIVIDLDDPKIFQYPFLYMIEPGHGDFQLDEGELTNLRTYLLRGGFLMVDDFWSESQWRPFKMEFDRILPPDEYPMVELTPEHEIFHCVFDLDEVPQVPSINSWGGPGGRTYEGGPGDGLPHIRAVFDAKGRMMVLIAFNTDLGDGWEREGENIDYFKTFSVPKAYPMGFNIVSYAMTH